MSVTCVEEDRISNLPEHLIDSILERVPYEDVRHIWANMKELIFDEQILKKFAQKGVFGHNDFMSVINQVLTLHKGPILKFHLYIPNMFLKIFKEGDQWMQLLSRKGVT
uniref:F-box domain-containing protein n=1 Tax=Lactuca sativa TaxID=4236 RepID=A0A9R1XUJ7_LACSA|nr:hypothetical protein LSAT_V11C100032390 [Lactuca sativa]